MQDNKSDDTQGDKAMRAITAKNTKALNLDIILRNVEAMVRAGGVARVPRNPQPEGVPSPAKLAAERAQWAKPSPAALHFKAASFGLPQFKATAHKLTCARLGEPGSTGFKACDCGAAPNPTTTIESTHPCDRCAAGLRDRLGFCANHSKKFNKALPAYQQDREPLFDGEAK